MNGQHKKILLLTSIFVLSFVPSLDACRFWGAIGIELQEELTRQQLLGAEYSLKNLGSTYQDGWSVAYYDDTNPIVYRGELASNVDGRYTRAVLDTAAARPNIIVGHLRRASSGCVEGVVNPHPFIRNKNGKQWLFGHNGGIKKDLLIELIGNEYLQSNLPETCTYDAPNSWVDSELYFIYLLKVIEEHNWNVVNGLKEALNELYARVDEKNRYFNFFLTDGNSLWAFRKGTSLFYKQHKDLNISLISSTIPDRDPSGWFEFKEDTIATLRPREEIRFLSIFE